MEHIGNALYNLMSQYCKMKFFFAKEHPSGLTKSQLQALMILNNEKEMKISCLGEAMNMPKGSMTSIVDALEKLEYVERVPDPSDRRVTLLRLRNKGRKFVEQRLNLLDRVINSNLKETPEVDKERLLSLINELTDVLQSLNKDKK